MISRRIVSVSSPKWFRPLAWVPVLWLVALLPGCTSGPVPPTVAPATSAAVIATPEPASPTPRPSPTLAERLSLAAPDADPDVLALAVQAQQCATASGTVEPVERLAVIDYSRPSTEPRLWVFSLADASLLFHEHVALG